MKRFIGKAFFIVIVALILVLVKNRSFLHSLYESYYYDTFNVFHWDNIRFTTAEPNKNFVKTKYIVENPKKFNSFVFGSSRVGNIPPERLPAELNGTKLNWYNMTYSVGIPAEHYLTVQTFIRNKVNVKMVIVGFDNISMQASIEDHKKDLLRMPYQVYEESKKDFLLPYLQLQIDQSIINEIDSYDRVLHESDWKFFYKYGTSFWVTDTTALTENPELERYKSTCSGYRFKDSYKDIEQLVDLCDEHGIVLVLFTSPMYQSLYKNSVEDGYFDFLRKVAQRCEFYNFSTLNNFTMNPKYYYEWSHYRPALGLRVEKVIFGTDEELAEVRREAGDDLFGMKVNSENVDYIITRLNEQLEN